MNHFISKCCNASVLTYSKGIHDPNWYQACEKCKLDCDVISVGKHLPKFEIKKFNLSKFNPQTLFPNVKGNGEQFFIKETYDQILEKINSITNYKCSLNRLMKDLGF